jgi:hypothetical protein
MNAALEYEVAGISTSCAALLKNRAANRSKNRRGPGAEGAAHANELKEAAMLARARTAVIESGEWLTAAQVAEMAQFSSSNPSAQPNKWKRDGFIFAIRHNGIDYFPSYALDPHTGYRPRKSMSEIIKTLGAAKDGWGLSYWFMSDNSFLDTEKDQYPVTRLWAEAIHGECPDVQGLCWTSRQDDSARAVVGASINLLRVARAACDARCTARAAALLGHSGGRSLRFLEAP